jgi:hypothetical protein
VLTSGYSPSSYDDHGHISRCNSLTPERTATARPGSLVVVPLLHKVVGELNTLEMKEEPIRGWRDRYAWSKMGEEPELGKYLLTGTLAEPKMCLSCVVLQ